MEVIMITWLPDCLITWVFVCCTRWCWPCAHSWAASCLAERGGTDEVSGRWTSYRAGRRGGWWVERLPIYKTGTFSSDPYLGYFWVTNASCPAQTDPFCSLTIPTNHYQKSWAVILNYVLKYICNPGQYSNCGVISGTQTLGLGLDRN